MSGKCGFCNANTSDKRSKYVLCCFCGENFHLKCSKISQQFFDLVKKEGALWSCETCKSKKSSESIDAEFSTQAKSKKSVTLNSRKSSMIPIPCDSSRKTAQVDDLISDLKLLKIELKNEIENVKKLEIERHLKFYSEKLDDGLAKIKINEDMSTEIFNLKLNNEVLSKEVEILKGIVNVIDQERIENNIEIRGIPVINECSDFEVLKAVAQEINVDIREDDIKDIYRTRKTKETDDRQSTIIVKFNHFGKKQQFKQSAKFLKTDKKDFKKLNQKLKVFVNDHLTTFNKALLYEAKQFAKLNNYKYVWVKNNMIFIKISHNAIPIHVKSFKDVKAKPILLQNLFN